MTQSRDVTAQFSTMGWIEFSPTPATFSQLQDAAVPPPLTVAMRNTGDLQIVLTKPQHRAVPFAAVLSGASLKLGFVKRDLAENARPVDRL